MHAKSFILIGERQYLRYRYSYDQYRSEQTCLLGVIGIMKTAQTFLNKFNSMKTLPHVAIGLTKLISSENSSMQEFEKIIKMDPVLVLRLIRLVNSSYYGLRQRVESISRIVVLLGMNSLRNMVVVEALREIYKENPNRGRFFSRPNLWLHCAAVAICCQMISERIFGVNGEDAFLSGILHDIGMIVEDQVAADLFLKTCQAYKAGSVPFTHCEKEIIDTNHCKIGYLLACEWKLPSDVQKGIRDHHSIQNQSSPSSISGIVQISEFLASKSGYAAIPGMKPSLSPQLKTYVSDNVDEFVALMNGFSEEVEKAEEFYKPCEE